MQVTSDIDLASLTRQIKQVGQRFGDTQEQAIKRWGVQTARELALMTQAYGRKATVQKLAITRDARNVIYTHKGASKKTPRGFSYLSNGKRRSCKASQYLETERDVINWIDSQRRSSKMRTRQLPIHERKICKEAVFKRAINQKHRAASGTAKDGFIDAGTHISRSQRGRRPERIGVSFIKWARHGETHGHSRKRRRGLRTSAELINLVDYTKKNHVLKDSDKKKAVRSGARKTLKWYRYTMRAEAKKKRK